MYSLIFKSVLVFVSICDQLKLANNISALISCISMLNVCMKCKSLKNLFSQLQLFIFLFHVLMDDKVLHLKIYTKICKSEKKQNNYLQNCIHGLVLSSKSKSNHTRTLKQKQLNRMQPLVILLFAAVLFLLWHVKMSSIKMTSYYNCHIQHANCVHCFTQHLMIY